MKFGTMYGSAPVVPVKRGGCVITVQKRGCFASILVLLKSSFAIRG